MNPSVFKLSGESRINQRGTGGNLLSTSISVYSAVLECGSKRHTIIHAGVLP